ncbi:hypothetical protein [Kitasatospora nipponensis]
MTVTVLLTAPLVLAAGLSFSRIGMRPARHRATGGRPRHRAGL